MTELREESDGSGRFNVPQDDPDRLPEGTEPPSRARVPEPGQAEVTHYAYDPQTFEIVCRPGQQLSQRKAARLQELDLYAHVVKFAG